MFIMVGVVATLLGFGFIFSAIMGRPLIGGPDFLSIIAGSALIVLGIWLLIDGLKRQRELWRARKNPHQVFLKEPRADGIGFNFDFGAFLYSIRARGVSIWWENGESHVACRIGKYRFYLTSKLVEVKGGTFEVSTEYTWEYPHRECTLKNTIQTPLVHYTRNYQVAFSGAIFDRWREEVAYTAANYKSKDFVSPSRA